MEWSVLVDKKKVIIPFLEIYLDICMCQDVCSSNMAQHTFPKLTRPQNTVHVSLGWSGYPHCLEL